VQQLVLWANEASSCIRRDGASILAADVQGRYRVQPGVWWLQPVLRSASEAAVAMVACVSAAARRRLLFVFFSTSEMTCVVSVGALNSAAWLSG